jgi:hypothetical protein
LSRIAVRRRLGCQARSNNHQETRNKQRNWEKPFHLLMPQADH